MSKAKYRMQELAEYRISRQQKLSDDSIKKILFFEVPYWKEISDKSRSKYIGEKKNQIRQEENQKLIDIKAKIAGEKLAAKQEIDRIKFPLSSSKDLAEIAIGTQMRTNAMLFLQMKPTRDRIEAEIKSAFDQNQIDYAFALEQNCIGNIETDPIGQPRMSADQKALAEAMSVLNESFSRRDQIVERENDLKQMEKCQIVADQFLNQAEMGKDSLVSPLLFPMVSDDQKNEMLAQVQAGGSLVESIAFKRMAAETI